MRTCDWKGCGLDSAGPVIVKLHEHDDALPGDPHTDKHVFHLCVPHCQQLTLFVQDSPLHLPGGFLNADD